MRLRKMPAVRHGSEQGRGPSGVLTAFKSMTGLQAKVGSFESIISACDEIQLVRTFALQRLPDCGAHPRRLQGAVEPGSRCQVWETKVGVASRTSAWCWPRMHEREKIEESEEPRMPPWLHTVYRKNISTPVNENWIKLTDVNDRLSSVSKR